MRALPIAQLTLRLLPLWAFTAFTTAAQTSPTAAASIEPGPPNGLQVYNVSAFSSWYSSAIPSGTLSFGQNRLPSDVANGGGVTIGARRQRSKADITFSYSGTYQSMVRYSEARQHSQFAGLEITWRPKPRWTLGISAVGTDTTSLEALLNPGTISAFGTTPFSVDNFAASASQAIPDPSVASFISGSPFLRSPSELFLFGRRLLSASVNTNLTWMKSPRLRFYFGGVSAAAQHVKREEGDQPYRSPHSIGANVGVGFTYSLTPRTDVGMSGGVERVHSAFQDAFISTGSVSVGRRMSTHWFAYGKLGAGSYTPGRSAFFITQVPQLIGSAQIAYQKRSYMMTVSYGRTLSDQYGFGVGRQSSTMATVLWHGKKWSGFAGGGLQQTESVGFAALRGWSTSSGLSRMLNSHLYLQLQHAYTRTDGHFQTTPASLDLQSIRVSLNWSPTQAFLRPLRGSHSQK